MATEPRYFTVQDVRDFQGRTTIGPRQALAAPAPASHPPGTRARGPQGDIIVLGEDGQWHPEGQIQGTAVPERSLGEMFGAVMAASPIGRAHEALTAPGVLPTAQDLHTGQFFLDVASKAARDATVGLATLPRDIDQALPAMDPDGQTSFDATPDLVERLVGAPALDQVGLGQLRRDIDQAYADRIAARTAFQTVLSDLLAGDVTTGEARQSLSSYGQSLAQRAGDAVETALPPRPTGTVAGDVAADVSRFVVPATGAAVGVGRALANAPRVARTLGQMLGAGASDAVVANPPADRSLGDLAGVGPTQTEGRSPLGQRAAIAAEGATLTGIAEAAIRAVRAWRSAIRGRGAAEPGGAVARQGPEPEPETPGGGGAQAEDDILRDFEERLRRGEGFGGQRGNAESSPGRGPRTGRDDAADQREGRAQQEPPPRGPADEIRYTDRAPGPDPEGRFAADEDGFVLSDGGGPLWFDNPGHAARWVVGVGNRSNGRQIFELAVHPAFQSTGRGAQPVYTVRVRGLQEVVDPMSGRASRSGAQADAGASPRGTGAAPEPRQTAQRPEPGPAPSAADARQATQGVGQPEATAGNRGALPPTAGTRQAALQPGQPPASAGRAPEASVQPLGDQNAPSRPALDASGPAGPGQPVAAARRPVVQDASQVDQTASPVVQDAPQARATTDVEAGSPTGPAQITDPIEAFPPQSRQDEAAWAAISDDQKQRITGALNDRLGRLRETGFDGDWRDINAQNAVSEARQMRQEIEAIGNAARRVGRLQIQARRDQGAAARQRLDRAVQGLDELIGEPPRPAGTSDQPMPGAAPEGQARQGVEGDQPGPMDIPSFLDRRGTAGPRGRATGDEAAGPTGPDTEAPPAGARPDADGGGGRGAEPPRDGQAAGRGQDDGGTTLSANPFANPTVLRQAAPELINAGTAGAIGYYETGDLRSAVGWALAGYFGTMGLMRVPIRGRTVLGPDSHGSAALRAVADAAAKTPGVRHFHPRGGVSAELWSKIQAMRTATGNWQRDAVALAKDVTDRFSLAERVMMSDWIEREGGFRQATEAVRRQAEQLAQMAEQIGEQLVDAGMLDANSFERLRGQYLHRYYAARLRPEQIPRRIRETIQGSWGKRRGETVRIPQPTGARTPNMGDTITHMVRPGDGRARYAQAGEIAGLTRQGYVSGKTWRVDRLDGDHMTLWRDYTPAERQAMGEIRDASYRFARGMMEASHDLALGKMFAEIASNGRWASQAHVDGWVKVPTSRVGQTQINKYGRLAGMWVDPEVMDAIRTVRKPWTNTSSQALNAVVRTYLRVLGAWKIGKTAYNPATHFNNIMSNVSLSLISGEVGPTDLLRALRVLRQKNSPVMDEARRAGLSLDIEVNVGDELQRLDADLAGLAGETEGRWARLLDFFIDNKITRFYSHEDQIFKLASYMRQRSAGMSPEEATRHAHQFFFDYRDVPVGVQLARDMYVPFITYVYKVAPTMARIAVEAPHRIVAAFGLLSGMSMASYGILYPHAPAAREDYERFLLPRWVQGRSGVGAQRAIRLPFNKEDEQTGEERAMFLNSRYFLPGGDFLDFVNNSDLGPSIWPQALGGTPLGGNPFVTSVYGMLQGQDPFFGKDIYPYPETDWADPDAPMWQKLANIGALARWLSYQWMPPITTWSADKLGTAAVGEGLIGEDTGLAQWMGWTGTDYAGRQLDMAQALLQIAGIKVTDINTAEQERFHASTNLRVVRDAINRFRRGAMDQRTTDDQFGDYQRALDDAVERMNRELARVEELRRAAQ